MEERDKFGVSMEEQLRQWKERIDEAKAEAEKQGPEFLERYAPLLEALTARYEEAKVKMKLLRMSGGDAWTEVRHGFEKAFDEMKSAVSRALEKF